MQEAAEAELAIGRHRETLDELRAWSSEHPLDERLRGLLMLALYRCGRQADALAVYRDGRELLVEELGIDPSRELRELEQQILEQDPALDLDRVATPDADGAPTVVRSSVRTTRAVLVVDGRTVPLARSVTRIGRTPGQDVVVDDPGVSRIHAEVRRSGDVYRVADAGSSNGTSVNGERASSSRRSPTAT